MKNITSNAELTRSANGGHWYCRICNYSSSKQSTMFWHAAGHLGRAYLKILDIVSWFK